MTISAKENNATEDLRTDYFEWIKCTSVSYLLCLWQMVILQVKCMKNSNHSFYDSMKDTVTLYCLD